jgi:hypothetical protein
MKMKLAVSLFLLTLVFSLCSDARAQSSPAAAAAEAELENLLIEAEKQTRKYIENFRNLTAAETKTIETLDENGRIEKRRLILSDLIIYETRKNPGGLREYRNVRAVDGKEIENRDKRAAELFEKLTDADSFDEEIRRIERESLRYDSDASYNGFTLTQGIFLQANLRPSFAFEIVGGETVDGSETIVLNFRQAAANPSINFKIDAPDFLKFEPFLFRGTIWLDAKSKKIRRARQEIIGNSPLLTEPFVFARQEFFYRPIDEFEIFLPVRMIFETFNFKAGKSVRRLLKENSRIKPDAYVKTRYALEYKNFKRFDVKVEAETKTTEN